jgi:hypothetical protein
LRIEQPDPQQVSLADAWTANTRMLGDYLAQQQAEAQRRGLWTGGQVWEGGHPTAAGATDAAGQYAQGVLMGTTAPGSPGFTAYHGSPHDFSAFDTSKIGTGEGAQAYGHGLYFAENEGVARGYRDALTQDRGVDRYWTDNTGKRVDLDAYSGGIGPQADAVGMLRQSGSVDEAIQLAKQYGPNAFIGGQKQMDSVLSGLQKFKDAGLTQTVDRGHMYEVNIAADPAHFLDWDKPMHEQSPYVQERLSKILGYDVSQAPTSPFTGKPLTGPFNPGAAWQNVVNEHGLIREGAAVRASQTLQDAGIPGIRYLDAGSRGAGTGTSNHVVFDASTIDILRKYGIAGLLAGGGAAATAGQSQPQQ